MLLFAVASIVVASPAEPAPGAQRRAPEVRATATATVRLLAARIVDWSPTEATDQPKMRDTTVVVNGVASDAKLVEFQ